MTSEQMSTNPKQPTSAAGRRWTVMGRHALSWMAKVLGTVLGSFALFLLLIVIVMQILRLVNLILTALWGPDWPIL